MQRPATLLILVLAAALAGCTGIDVKQDYDPAVNFQTLERYAWYEAPESDEGKTVAESPLVENRIRRAIDRALAGQGYRKTTPERADFLVAYYYRVREGGGESGRRVHTGVGIGGGSHGTFTSFGIGIGLGGRRGYKDDVLTIDFLDPRNNRLIWRGTAEERLVWSNDPDKTTERINKTVNAILSKFPPAGKP